MLFGLHPLLKTGDAVMAIWLAAYIICLDFFPEDRGFISIGSGFFRLIPKTEIRKLSALMGYSLKVGDYSPNQNP